MSQQEFEREVLQRLASIEANQRHIVDECAPCRQKVDMLSIEVARIDASAKSAHHRLDTMQSSTNELKKELTEAIKEQIAGIYRTAMMLGGLAGFFVGIITWLIKH